MNNSFDQNREQQQQQQLFDPRISSLFYSVRGTTRELSGPMVSVDRDRLSIYGNLPRTCRLHR